MKAPSKPRVLPPAGTHLARVINIIYLGTVKGNFGESFKVRITWELPTETHVFKEGEEAKPFVVSREFGLAMGKKSHLRPIVEGVLGVALKDEEAYSFDVDEILGKECLLNISLEDTESGTYANVNTASKLVKGMTCPPAVNPLKVLSYEKWDQKYYDALPGFLKEKMEKTPEFKKLKGEDVVNEDEIPF
jgi:hypothetical protein